ncbi:MAG TPA: ATP-binding cassette domain-containing protein [Thermoanaerobaculia bacterium]|nr:ATP-binding cassette domain-containing protein [Thermoanaerobaculia bacterium]
MTRPEPGPTLSVPSPLLAHLWPAEDLLACLRETAAASGLDGLASAAPVPLPPPAGGRSEPAGTSFAAVESAAAALGIEADPAALPWDTLPEALARAGPALIEIRGERRGFLALLPSGGRRRVALLAPDGHRHRLPAARLTDALRISAAGQPGSAGGPVLDPLLAGLGLSAARLARLRRALADERLRNHPQPGLYLLTAPAARPLRAQLRRARLLGLALGLLACRGAQRLLLVLAWGLLAGAALGQAPAAGWLAAWPLLLLTLAAARLGERTVAARLLARGATLLRRRLLAALLALAPDSLRRQGTGQLLGRILAAESLESLGLAGLPAVLLALTDLGLALPLLYSGAAPLIHTLLSLAWLLLAGLFGSAYLRYHRAVADSRLEMTHDLVEKLASHRTRLAQESPARRHAEEDAALARHHALCRRLDAQAVLVRTVLPGGWLVAALAALIPAAAEAPLSAAHLAVSLGGIVLASAAWSGLAACLLDLAEATSAVAQLRPLFGPAAAASRASGDCRQTDPPSPGAGLGLAAAGRPGEPILEARSLTVRLPGRTDPLVARCDLAIHSGDRLLLTGPSGAGKSTLARVLAADLSPGGGLLLLHGLDLPTLGPGAWRRRVVLVPQLHANHVFAESLAFNLLLGRGWPPSPADLDEAERLCRELGLGSLLDRLRAGLEQRVGEAGWQLSHGETARVCVARALLQEPELLVLDESLAALDPGARIEVLDCLAQKTQCLLLITHS